MTPFDAVVVDVDGTVCFDGHTIADDIVEALREVRAASRLVIASARPIRDLLPVLPADLHSVDLIGGNGAFRRPAGADDITVSGFTHEVRAALDDIVARHGIGALLDDAWDFSYTADPDHPLRARVDPLGSARHRPAVELANYAKGLLFTTDAAVVAELTALGVSFSVHPIEGAIDIAPPGITKASAVREIGIAHFAAFGNDTNDITLLRAAAHSVRIGTHPDLAFASLTVDEAGVAAALRATVR